MITFKSLLNEAPTPYDLMKASEGGYTAVYKVLTVTRLKALVNEFTDVRGVFKDGVLYCWDGERAIHKDFEDKFGKGTNNMVIWIESGKVRVDVWGTPLWKQADPFLTKLLDGVKN